MSGDFDIDVSDFETISQHDIEACQREFQSGGVEGCRRLLVEKQEEWKSIPLNVAVIGNSGVGKSSFINAIRRLTGDDDGAAAVGVTETTTDVMGYPHPNNPMLKFWDLPGVGTPRFPKDGYLEAVQVYRYDFFLLMSATRFTENDTWLGNEISKINRRYFYVRTKLGSDISSDRKAHPRTHDERAVIDEIRQNVLAHLKQDGCERTPPVFLVDSYKPQKFDFEQLEQNLNRDFPEMKRSAMIFSMCAYSQQMVRMKVGELRSRIWKVATASAAVAAVPVPGLSIVFDACAVKAEAEFYFTQLGLDDNSLRNHAAMTLTDYNRLKAIVNRTCGPAFLSVQGMKAVAQFVPEGVFTSATSLVVEEFARYIPFIGSIVAAPISFAGTYYMLRYLLDRLETVAMEVVNYAAENAGNHDNHHDDDDE